MSGVIQSTRRCPSFHKCSNARSTPWPKIGDKGLTVQAHIRGSFFELAEPVVAGGHLYLRSVTNRNFPQIIQEMQANLGDNTLYCVDLTK